MRSHVTQARERSTAEEQLNRILYILPAAARQGGALVDDLARELDVTPERVLAELEEATARAYHHPAGMTEPFSILVDRRRVLVHAPHDFDRPTRLNHGEALALGLGLRVLAAEVEPSRRHEILELAERLEAALCTPGIVPADPPLVGEDGVDYEAHDLALALGDDAFRGVVADAVTQGVLCELWYLKPGEVAPEQRRVAPHRIVYAEGRWYIAALDVARDGLRFFRMDRVLDATLLDEPAPAPPPELEEWIAAAPYIGIEELRARVRYAPEAARWIAERDAAESRADGSVVVERQVSDPRWLVRHVLQYGGAAVVEGPPPARSWIAAAAGRLLGGPDVPGSARVEET